MTTKNRMLLGWYENHNTAKRKEINEESELEYGDRKYKCEFDRVGEREGDTLEDFWRAHNERRRAKEYRDRQSKAGAKQLTIKLQPHEVDLYKGIAQKYGDGNITKSVKDGLLLLEAIRRKPALLDHIYENSSRATKKSLGELWIYDPIS